jgi:hypothetical protein
VEEALKHAPSVTEEASAWYSLTPFRNGAAVLEVAADAGAASCAIFSDVNSSLRGLVFLSLCGTPFAVTQRGVYAVQVLGSGAITQATLTWTVDGAYRCVSCVSTLQCHDCTLRRR